MLGHRLSGTLTASFRPHREIIICGAGRKGGAACPRPPSLQAHGNIDDPMAETKPLGLPLLPPKAAPGDAADPAHLSSGLVSSKQFHWTFVSEIPSSPMSANLSAFEMPRQPSAQPFVRSPEDRTPNKPSQVPTQNRSPIFLSTNFSVIPPTPNNRQTAPPSPLSTLKRSGPVPPSAISHQLSAINFPLPRSQPSTLNSQLPP